ncbi:DUF397 domain-containing protein [Actinomycetes bacterium KLBMP 9797]
MPRYRRKGVPEVIRRPVYTDSLGAWKKSRRSAMGNECVELCFSSELVLMRSSKHRRDGFLSFERPRWTEFLEGVRAGEFDR